MPCIYEAVWEENKVGRGFINYKFVNCFGDWKETFFYPQDFGSEVRGDSLLWCVLDQPWE
jgi:hypothetical protein